MPRERNYMPYSEGKIVDIWNRTFELLEKISLFQLVKFIRKNIKKI